MVVLWHDRLTKGSWATRCRSSRVGLEEDRRMKSLQYRFDKEGVIEALLRQRLMHGERELAEKFADKGRTVEYAVGEVLIEQGAWDDDLYFILAGEVAVQINGQEVQRRKAGEAVGELAGLSRARARTASLEATVP